MDTQSRRRFLATLTAASAAALIGGPSSLAQEGPPETMTIRLAKPPGLCVAPQFLVGEFLRAEGFDVLYLASDAGINQAKAIADGEIDLTLHFASSLLVPIHAGEKITVIAGVHVGCFELLATERIRTIADLKGKMVGVDSLGSARHLFISTMAAYVGLGPAKDIIWVTSPAVTPAELFVDGKNRCVARLSARTTGLTRPQVRSCARQ
jgi:NitT/TauT family transport system substrate-binding protein